MDAARQDGLIDQVLHRLDFRLVRLGGAMLTVGSLLKLVVALGLLLFIAGRLRRWTIRKVLTHSHLDEGVREAVGSLVRYAVLLLGLLLILQNTGIHLTALTVVAGALSVGVGFGLQNIISNFISGLIVMFERPVKVGDRIEIDGVEGTVAEIGARRATVVTDDRIAILVPNQTFITSKVVNLVYLDDAVRLRVPAAVAAGSDIAQVREVLLEVARGQPDVHRQPAPSVLLPSMTAAALNFELVVWFDARRCQRLVLQSDLNFAIAQALRAHAIQSAG